MKVFCGNKSFSQILLSIAVSISATIVVLSSILYFNFNRLATSVITAYVKENLSQISYSATFMNYSASNMAKQLLSDPSIQYLLSNQNPSFPQLTVSLNQLTAYKSSSAFVQSIYVYNKNTDTMYSTLNYGVSARTEFADQEVFPLLAEPSRWNMQKPVFRTAWRDVYKEEQDSSDGRILIVDSENRAVDFSSLGFTSGSILTGFHRLAVCPHHALYRRYLPMGCSSPGPCPPPLPGNADFRIPPRGPAVA